MAATPRQSFTALAALAAAPLTPHPLAADLTAAYAAMQAATSAAWAAWLASPERAAVTANGWGVDPFDDGFPEWEEGAFHAFAAKRPDWARAQAALVRAVDSERAGRVMVEAHEAAQWAARRPLVQAVRETLHRNADARRALSAEDRAWWLRPGRDLDFVRP